MNISNIGSINYKKFLEETTKLVKYGKNHSVYTLKESKYTIRYSPLFDQIISTNNLMVNFRCRCGVYNYLITKNENIIYSDIIITMNKKWTHNCKLNSVNELFLLDKFTLLVDMSSDNFNEENIIERISYDNKVTKCNIEYIEKKMVISEIYGDFFKNKYNSKIKFFINSS